MLDEFTSLGGCTILNLLGEGGMASVYRARRESDGEILALKVMSRRLNISPEFVKRFEREAKLMASFDHPHILPVYSFATEGSHTYLLMKLIEGENLKNYTQKRQTTLADILIFLEQIADALDYAHQRGVVHRDLKPANVLIDNDGTSYLSDFGIAKFKEESIGLTAAGMVIGTPSYMAPEQWRSEPIDARTDVYAFGVMIYELLTGKLPFDSENPFSLMYRHLDEPAPGISAARRDLPKGTDRVVRRAMAKVQEDRYPSASAVIAALRQALEETDADQKAAPVLNPPIGGDYTPATLDSPTITDLDLEPKTVVGGMPDEKTVIGQMADDRTMTPAEAPTLDSEDAEFLYQSTQYNSVDVGARSLLARAKEAAEEASGEAALLAEAVVRYVQDLREQAKHKPDNKQGPYRALESYDIGDNKLFFGRETAIQAMLDRSPFARFTVLHAESGAGKTSLLRAGIMPRLLAGGYLPLYVAVRRRPPQEAIKHILLPEGGELPELRAYLKTLVQITGHNREIFIFIDQFETFFTDVFTEADRAAFINEIAECLDDDLLPVRITLAMRTEYFGLLASFQPAIAQPFAHEFLLRALNPEEAKRALILPAHAQGYLFEKEVAETVLDDLAGSGGEIAPPQLQLVGGALIDILPPDRKTIQLDDYLDAGRAEGVLQGYLERLLNRFSLEDRRAARLVIEGLVRADQTRDVRTREGLVAELALHHIPAQQVDSVLHTLRENRVLRVVELDDQSAYELVHDYLALQVQIDPETIARKAAQELLERRIADFERYNSLLTQQELNVITPQLEQLTLSSAAERLISQTRARQRRQRRLTVALSTAAILGVIGVLALGLLAALRENQNRQERLEIAQTSEARLAVQRDIALGGQVGLRALLELDENRVDSALLLAVESMHIADTQQSRSSLLTVLQNVPQLDKILHDHTDWVHAVAYNPDGSSFASASEDHSVILWDASTNLSRRLEGHSLGVWALDYSPDGKKLASAGDDGQIIIWDAASGEIIHQWANNGASILALAFSPDGKILAAGQADNLVFLWDTATWELLQTLQGHTDRVFSVAFSPDGAWLASGSGDNSIILWKQNPSGEFEAAKTLSGHTNWVLDVAFSPDGSTLASVSADNTLRLWDVLTGSSHGQPITDHTDWVRSVAYSGNLLVTGSRDKTIILRDAATGQRLPDVPPLRGHSDEVHSLAFSPDGSHMVSGGEDGKVLVWNMAERQPLSRTLTGHTGWVYSLAYSPDGAKIFSGSGDMTALLWDAVSGQIAQNTFSASSEILSVARSSDGVYYAYGDINGNVTLGCFACTPTVIDAHNGNAVRSVAFSPDSKILATGGDDHLIRLWHVANWTPLGEALAAHQDWIAALAFSPDGKLLASGSQDHTIILWDTQTWQIARTLPTLHTDGITSLQFSHDGRQLVSGNRDGTLILWDVATGQAVGSPMVGHQNWVMSVAISTDGKMLASGGRDEQVILWDTASGQAIGQPLIGHQGWVMTVTFSPDGGVLASGSQDGEIRLWDVDPISWQKRACHIANVSPQQEAQYLSTTDSGQLCTDIQ